MGVPTILGVRDPYDRLIGDPHNFIVDPQIFIGNPKLFVLNPKYSLETNSLFSIETPSFHWSRKILIEDLRLFFGDPKLLSSNFQMFKV